MLGLPFEASSEPCVASSNAALSQGHCYALLSVLLEIKPLMEGLEPKTLNGSIPGLSSQSSQKGS